MSSPAPYSADFAPEETTVSDRRKIDPQNIEAEKSVLAACMLNQEAIEEVAPKLVKENFYRIAHQRIYESMMDLYVRHIPIDHISLADNLKAMGQLEAVGGKAYVTEKRVSSAFKRMDVLLTEAFEELTKLAEQKDAMAGIPSGFKDVDDLFHGFRGGDLVILAARPGVGKTSFALNLATNAAKAGATVTFLSLEMSAAQLVQRILCAEARVNLSRLRAGQVQESDWGAIADASNTLSKLDMFIDDTPSLSILELRAKARRELRSAEKGIIIVDYLQLMSPPQSRKDGNRAVEVGEISRGLKVLAKEMDMPVIALSQLSRAVEMRGKKRPMLSDLRESGSIEQDADIVMFIDRSMDEIEAESEDRPDLGSAELIVAKHRNGPTRDIPLAFNAEYTRFMDFIDDSRVGGYM